jgi:hypothetical protein
MPWAAGAFTRVYGSGGWVADRDAATPILATRHDTHDQDVADGINACLAKDGTNAATANLNIGNFRLTSVADPVNPQDAATRAFVLSNASIVFVSGDQIIWRSTVNPYTVPTGWTRAAQNDKALRLSSGSGALSSGGTNAFSTALNTSRTTTAEASHTHTINGSTSGSTGNPGVEGVSLNPGSAASVNHQHTMNFTSGAGSSHSHTLNLDVQWYEMNIIQKT